MMRTLEQLPLILCGPILRRVEARQVSVFVALKAPRFIELVLRNSTDPASPDLGYVPERQPTVALGEHLHVAVVTRHLATPLTAGSVYGYDLRFYEDIASLAATSSLATEHAHTLDGRRLLEDSGDPLDPPLGYEAGKLPGLMLPPAAADGLRFVHGSCRKPHGGGSDLLALLDDLLRDTHHQAQRRPQLLILTGDQIYADDVSLTLLRALYDMSRVLLGWSETAPSPHVFGAVRQTIASDEDWKHQDWSPGLNLDTLLQMFDPARTSRIAPPQRRVELTASARLTSDEMDGHLLFLGEFYLMYLFAWSNVPWPRDAQGVISLPAFGEAVPGYGLFGKFSRLSLDRQRDATLAFGRTLGKVRRALANIATYMMFDDHEVTDDWNLNHDWVQKVNGSPLGPHVLRNALMAYAVFQDWGNQPADYAEGGKGHDILQAVKLGAGSDPAARLPLYLREPDTLRAQLNLRANAADHPSALTERKTWHYAVAPHGDATGYRILTLDTRTARGFPSQTQVAQLVSDLKAELGEESNPSEGLVLPAALLSDDAFEVQLTQRLGKTLLNIVVSPAPVFGVPPMEDLIQRVAVQVNNPEYADDEAWAANAEAFGRFIDALMTCDKGVLLLSGDVHYAFTGRIGAPQGAAASVPPARIVQLCASALKNETPMTYAMGKVGHAMRETDWVDFVPEAGSELDALIRQKIEEEIDLRRRHLHLSDGVLTEREMNLLATEVQRWWYDTPSILDRGATLLAFRDLTPFTLPDLLPKQLLVAIAAERGVRELLISRRGPGVFENARFRVRFLNDARPEPDRWGAVRAFNETTRGVPAGSAAEQQALQFALKQARDIVGYNNLGEVSLRRAGDLEVLHRLWWYAHSKGGVEQKAAVATDHAGTLTTS